uniref:Uncharacterized protein n=1 Tax=Vitis vinifera TaxID=29760 RepID=A5AD38_VITVI|nr:hypothetical protein VITISV_017601 [Vitis vinifera]
MAAHVLLGNPDGVDPDSLARSVSSRRGVPTPCTRRRSPLRNIAHSTRVRILSDRLSTFSGYFMSRIWCANILHPDISQPDGRGGRFNFSGQTYPDSLIALTRRIFLLVYSAVVINFVDYSLNQRAPAGHESAETPIGNESHTPKGPLDTINTN